MSFHNQCSLAVIAAQFVILPQFVYKILEFTKVSSNLPIGGMGYIPPAVASLSLLLSRKKQELAAVLATVQLQIPTPLSLLHDFQFKHL